MVNSSLWLGMDNRVIFLNLLELATEMNQFSLIEEQVPYAQLPKSEQRDLLWV